MDTLLNLTARRWACAAAAGALLLCLYGCSQPTEKKPAAVAEHAPEVYRVNLDTTKGAVIIEVTRNWAPLGADRFYELVKSGFFDGARFFRVVRNFVVQFGISGDPKVTERWNNTEFPDDPVKESNVKGTITFATRGPATRTTQVFINLRDNAMLDTQGFAPFGKVVSGMDAVEDFYKAYGDMPPSGEGPDPQRIQREGNQYLESHFPRLDYIKKATIAP